MTALASDGSPLRLMALHAHPDDEASKGAASMAMYAAEGVEVLVVTCTGGEAGSILNPAFTPQDLAFEEMPAVRRAEMAEAARILGIRQHWLGFVDSGLPEGDPLPPLPEGSFAALPLEDTVPALVEVVRDFRPQVITTYDENGGYPHPDHIRTHEISVAAFEAAADPDYRRDLGPAHAVAKLYFNQGLSALRIEALHRRLVEEGLESPFEGWVEQVGMQRFRPITTRVQCADFFPVRDEALRAHATQVDPNGNFFAVPLDVQVAAWPTDDFELHISRIGVRLPEDDLFAGLR